MHSDTHDVFVLQTAGTKQWELHPPEGDEEPLLEPGHVMYLPTGTPHAARAQDTVSLHITIGINQLTWRGLVERILALAAAEVPGAHLPAGYLDDPQALAPPAGPAPLRPRRPAPRRSTRRRRSTREVRRFLTSRPPAARGRAGRRPGADAIDDTTLLRRRPGPPVRPAGARATGSRSCSVTGASTCPPGLRPALDEVRRRDELRPRDLPLDEKSRLVLARRLVREGLLRVVPE